MTQRKPKSDKNVPTGGLDGTENKKCQRNGRGIRQSDEKVFTGGLDGTEKLSIEVYLTSQKTADLKDGG